MASSDSQSAVGGTHLGGFPWGMVGVIGVIGGLSCVCF